MIIRLDLDWEVEAGFYWWGRWPVALIKLIGEHKAELFGALAPNPLEPDMLIGHTVFTVEGHNYLVIYGSDRQQTSQHLLRVLHIQLVEKALEK